MNGVYIALRLYSALILLVLLAMNVRRWNQERSGADRFFLFLVTDTILMMTMGALEYSLQDWYSPTVVFLLDSMNVIFFYVLIAGYTHYLTIYISESHGMPTEDNYTRYAVILGVIGTVFWILTEYSGKMIPMYENSFYIMGQSMGLMILLDDIVLILRHSRKLGRRQTLVLLSHVTFPLVGMVLEWLLDIRDLRYCGITLSILFIYAIKNASLAGQIAEEVNRTRVELMQSQIRPHFLFNCLNTIYYLSGNQPDQAAEALSQFSDYLSCNIDAINSQSLVPFSQEIEHVRHYLALEKLRFGDTLSVEYDIREENFGIPLLSVQPLVENAVKHGIFRRRDGGHIVISSIRERHDYRISVRDDGVGFNTAAYKKDGKRHVGIDNVRRRLELEMGATLTVSSIEGKGTEAVIRIPVGGKSSLAFSEVHL